MGFNFPNSPATGTTYSPPGGPTFTWDGVTWKGQTQGVPVTVYMSDTAPSNPAYGQLWWQATTGRMFVWYADPDSAQWVQVSGSSTAAQTAETRNRIINGAMQVSQENGNTASTAVPYYAADQFQSVNSTAGTVSTQRVQVVTPNGSKDRFRVSVTVADTAMAAAEYLQMATTALEGIRVADFLWGTASAKQVIIRFGWKSPAGVYSFRLKNAANTQTYVVNFTISAAQANTDTEQTFVIPGSTTGVWPTDNAVSMGLSWVAATGTTYQSTAGWTAGNFLGTASNSNGMATAGAVYELYDVGLYLDPLNTGVAPAWQMPDYAQELAACQRYWQTERVDFNSYGAGAIPFTSRTYFATHMRIAPAITAPSTSIGNCTLQAYDIVGVGGFRTYVAITATGSFYYAAYYYASARM